MSVQRIKRKHLVEIVLSSFWKTAQQQGLSSIEGASIEIDTLREEIARISGTPRQNNKWILTQLRKYEEKEGVALFVKSKGPGGTEYLRVRDSLVTFVQKKHLYRAEKLRLANGAADFIAAERTDREKPLNVFLGAGTTTALLAEILCSREDITRGYPLNVYTNNMGVIDVLSRNGRGSLTLNILPGAFDPGKYCILSTREVAEQLQEIDLVIQGASLFHQGTLYVEAEKEAVLKRQVLTGAAGTKMLLLTLHEYAPAPAEGYTSFGSLEEFDLLLVPRMKHPAASQEEGLEWLLEGGGVGSHIKQWHYEIFSCLCRPGSQEDG